MHKPVYIINFMYNKANEKGWLTNLKGIEPKAHRAFKSSQNSQKYILCNGYKNYPITQRTKLTSLSLSASLICCAINRTLLSACKTSAVIILGIILCSESYKKKLYKKRIPYNINSIKIIHLMNAAYLIQYYQNFLPAHPCNPLENH